MLSSEFTSNSGNARVDLMARPHSRPFAASAAAAFSLLLYSLPDAPMCGCIEDMPIVSKADCTTYDEAGKIKACTKNDLRTSFEEHYPGVPVPNLVQKCDNI